MRASLHNYGSTLMLVLLAACKHPVPTPPAPEPEPAPEVIAPVTYAPVEVVPKAGVVGAMAFMPDGAMLFTDIGTDSVKVVDADGVLVETPFLDLSEVPTDETGIIGLTLAPDFAESGWVYLSLSSNLAAPPDAPRRSDVARIIRVKADGFVAAGEPELVVSTGMESIPGYEGANLHFGPDGHLYFAVGNRRPDPPSQDPKHVVGRMLRYDRDGGIPADNPWGPDNPTYALGLRNSWDFTFDPISGGLFATDNGPVGDDELNLVEAGANYGWPGVSGEPDLEPEIAFVAHTETRAPLTLLGAAPTGIVVDEPGHYGIPGALLIAEWTVGRIVQLTLSEDRKSVVDHKVLAEELPPQINALALDASGRLWFATTEAIYRLEPTPPEAE